MWVGFRWRAREWGLGRGGGWVWLGRSGRLRAGAAWGFLGTESMRGVDDRAPLRLGTVSVRRRCRGRGADQCE
ncbi:hypothetical protein Sgleb_46760 [Streptomyces glebosus]|uniref:Uncharacterized protein n=1 Tax=Streptomyces glebosus TaxID=249580 RepID=A0A640SYX9_9ACTN|nr:hypothetical protein Sgleb_46760 [Streptomyces glebosus]GHG75769.1 hypothetical protein GCM10010513_50620 [Streptomyces glebosus]